MSSTRCTETGPLKSGHKTHLRTWAEVHGYDPDLLAENKRLRIVDDCPYPNERPLSEHWTVDCTDHDVAVPGDVAGWCRVEPSNYRTVEQWDGDGRSLLITGIYGNWTVKHIDHGPGPNGTTLAETVPAQNAVQTVRTYMARHPQSDEIDVPITEGSPVSPTEPDPTDAPDWFDAFPPRIAAYDRYATAIPDDEPSTVNVIPDHRPQVTYLKRVPDEKRPVDRIRIHRENDRFVCRQPVNHPDFSRPEWRDTPDAIVFERHDATAAAAALTQYLHDDLSHADTKSAERSVPNAPDWFDTFPQQVGEYDRGDMVEADNTAHLTYYRRVPDRHVPVDLVRVTCEDGTYVAREQVKVHGRLRWQDTADSIVFQREADTAAADALVQYLLDGVDPDVYHNPDPHRVWPPEDLFTADTA